MWLKHANKPSPIVDLQSPKFWILLLPQITIASVGRGANSGVATRRSESSSPKPGLWRPQLETSSPRNGPRVMLKPWIQPLNVGKTIINQPFGNGLYHLFMVKLGWFIINYTPLNLVPDPGVWIL